MDASAASWEPLLRAVHTASRAGASLLLVRAEKGWTKLMLQPATDAVFRGETLDARMTRLLDATAVGAPGATAPDEPALVVLRFPDVPELALVMRGPRGWAGPPTEVQGMLDLLAQIPGLRRAADPSERLGGRIENMALVLDLVVLVSNERRFGEAVLRVVNEVAARLHCERVSLGWVRGGFCRAEAMSHRDKIDRRGEAARLLEAAMDESADQDEEVVVPAPADQHAVSRDHAALQVAGKAGAIASLPLRGESGVKGVLTAERGQPFAFEELAALRLVADLLAPVLARMEEESRWFGARWLQRFRTRAAGWLGPKNTGWKLLMLALLAGLCLLFFGGMTWRVEASFMVESDAVAQLPAPFEGHIDQVHFRVGDEVRKGQPLFSLDTRELALREAELMAELRRQQATAQKAEGERKLADLQVAKAAADEAAAQLALTRFRLAQAEVKAPFDGVMAEGDLREKLGAPVRQGDVLARLVQLDTLYFELAVDERDIHEVRDAARVEVAFAADPSVKFPAVVERIEPAAQTRDGANVFILRARPEKDSQAWWRPGMGGVAKITTERRSFWWILTHRTTDFLHLKLWW